jgi:arylformamidase
MTTFCGRPIDLAGAIDISIPLRFNGPQPNAFGTPPAASRPVGSGRLVGDTRAGGSCNFEQVTFIPHCNGTHTECVGHVTHERISVRDCLRQALFRAALVTVEPRPATGDEQYPMSLTPDDLVITGEMLRGGIPWGVTALIVRTSPNDPSKLTRQYGPSGVPFFTNDAVEYVVASGIEHLLVDLPSIDRADDDGRLSDHRIFWGIEQGSFERGEAARTHCTITEMVYVPEDVPDGEYVLNLQIAPFHSDASPSRPLLLPYAD